MKIALLLCCLSCCALLTPLSAQSKIPSTEKSLKSFIDKEISAFTTADNTEFIDRLKLTQRVWISYYRAELELATQATGMPLIAGDILKGKTLEKNIAKLKSHLIRTRYHDFIYKPAMVTELPKAAADYSNPLLSQMNALMAEQRQALAALSDDPEDSKAQKAAEDAAAPFSESYLLAAQQQFLLTQLTFADQMVTDWVKLKYKEHPNYLEILKAQQEVNKKWLVYLDAVQHLFIQQDKNRGQINAHRIAIAMLLRRLETIQKQLPFAN